MVLGACDLKKGSCLIEFGYIQGDSTVTQEVSPEANAIPEITVLMSVFNKERYLAEAVESILNQTFRDFEFIIIDDGSTDGSLEILQRYAAEDKRIRLVSRENRGLVATSNEGLELARAPLLARLDADDVALPMRLAKQTAFMREHHEVVCLGGAYELIDETGRFLTLLSPRLDNETIQGALIIGNCEIWHSAIMMRTASVHLVGGYDISFIKGAEDLDLFLKLGEVGELANLSDTLIRYRECLSSVSSQFHDIQLSNAARACRAAWKRRGVSGHLAIKAFRPRNRSEMFALMQKRWWWGFMRGDRHLALVYAWKAVWTMPYHPKGWWILARAIVMKGRKQA